MNKQNTALLFAEDPGAANYMRYLLHVLDDMSVEATFYASGTALKFLTDFGHKVAQIPGAGLDEFLKDMRPSFIFVGTSVNPDSPAFGLIELAKNMDIPTIGVVDAVKNSQLRFRGKSSDPLCYAPDFMFVTDKPTADEYIKLGFAKERIAVTGHPHYQEALCIAKKTSDADRAELRNKLLPKEADGRKVVLFASEPKVPVENDYRATEEMKGWGTTDDRTHVALQETLDALDQVKPSPYFVLRLHARESIEDFEPYMDRVSFVSQGGDPIQMALCSDVVVGMTSSLVFESVLVGVPAISILVSRRERNLLPEEVAGFIYDVYERSQLQESLHLCLAGKRPQGQEKKDISCSTVGDFKTITSQFIAGQMAATPKRQSVQEGR